MAPHSAVRSASATPQSHISNPRTPSSSSKHRPVSLIHRLITPSPCLLPPPSSSDHPVEVVGRIREHPEGSDKPSVLQVLQNGQTVRVRTDQGSYRDFGLDGVSLAASEDLQSFYKKYVESRIESVKLGARCTIMMYGPTGAGKSHTMFGSAKEPGIAYRALQNILGGGSDSPERVDAKYGSGSPDHSDKKVRVTVTILEIYNEEIFDLLASCSNTPNGHWTKPNMSRARLEIMGKKAKNTVSISGTDADKISKEIVKVEKRRVVKSTSCNERSSRSHCLVTLDVPALGGRLVLVDMAGSENLEQAGLGIDSKMQTGKINQGNIALKRVVEAIANGDSYIPFRDSKLTMLLQDSFEDDGAKILMILCASPDPRDMHKTIGTLEYGCKAKCIVCLPVSPAKDKSNSTDKMDPSVLEARIRAMEHYISKLESENQSKDKEKEETVKELMQKEQDLIALKKMLKQMEQESKERCSKCCNEDIRVEMENRIKECQKVAEEFIASGKKKLEEKVAEQQKEINCMRSRMKEIEKEVELFLKTIPAFSAALSITKKTDGDTSCKTRDVLENVRVAIKENEERILPPVPSATLLDDISRNSEKTATEIESGGLLMKIRDRNYIDYQEAQPPYESIENLNSQSSTEGNFDVFEHGMYEPNGWLPIIPEESEGEADTMADDEVNHDMSQRIPSLTKTARGASQAMKLRDHAESVDGSLASHPIHMDIDEWSSEDACSEVPCRPSENDVISLSSGNTSLSYADACVNLKRADGERHASPTCAASRRSRIENIFLLCGNHRELAAANTQNKPHELVPMSYCEITPDLNQQLEVPISIDYPSMSHMTCLSEGPHIGLSASSPTALKASPIISKEISGSKVMKAMDRSPEYNLSSKSKHSNSEGPHIGRSTSSPTALKASPVISKEISGSKVIKAMDRSPAYTSSSKSKHLFSENTPPCGMMPSYSSPMSMSSNIQTSKSPTMLNFEGSLPVASDASVERNPLATKLDADKCEVYVKWETSKDSSGKLINTIKIKRNATLAELRRELEQQVSEVKHDFTFLMLGDPSGAPVERESEAHLRVVSLPDCHKQRGSKLACLRPHLNRNAAVGSLGPLCPMENQMSLNTTKQVLSHHKSPNGFNPLKPNEKAAAVGSLGPLCPMENQMSLNTTKQVVLSHHKSPNGFNPLKPNEKAAAVFYGDQAKTNQRLSFPLISQVKGLRL